MFGIFATNDVDSTLSADRLLGVLQGSVSRTTRIATKKVKRTDSKRSGNVGGGTRLDIDENDERKIGVEE